MNTIYTDRWYQDDAIFAIFDYFQRGNAGNPVVAMPTGTGKSIVIAKFIHKVISMWPNQRLMMLTHVKELIEQNAEKLMSVWPVAPMGIYSAGLNSRDMILPIVFGGVQSVAPAIQKSLENDTSKPDHLKHFGWRDLLIIDECHLLSPEDTSRYQYIIAELKKINPYIKVIGLSATPYRSGLGMITENGIFTDICYDITDFESFNRLIAEGWLCPLTAKPTKAEIDVSSVGMVGADFNQKQLEKVSDDDALVYAICNESIQIASDRNCWMAFATGIDNIEHYASVLQSLGVEAVGVHSKLKKSVNDERIAAFKAGELKCLVSGQKLTTGFDNPAIDYILDANATRAVGKHVQKLGRGTRPHPGKTNCLVGDFAGNIRRLGPINDPRIPGKPSKGDGTVPIKICESCGHYNHATARQCENCGAAFSFKSNLFSTAGTLEPLKSDMPVVEHFEVKKVLYNLHEKRDKRGNLLRPPMIKVSYFCGLQMFNEFVMLEHPGLAAKKSRDWWRQRSPAEPPQTTYQALNEVSKLRVPKKVRVWLNKKYPEILSAEWE